MNDQSGRGTRTERRIWRFANCEFDESRRELRVEGAPVALEGKPLDILTELLTHAGEVVTKDELLDSVWPGLSVVEGSLATAVSKLRKALGDDGQSLIVTVPRIGYRLVADVQVSSAAALRPPLPFDEGDAVPGREQWRLVRRLDSGDTAQVWLAEHAKTRERRVFKFAGDAIGLGYLKREATLSRLLREGLGERPDFARVLEWNFETPPFYLESEYGGPDLEQWAQAQGGLANIPMSRRVEIVAGIARMIFAAHEVGVLHKDLKPSNVLVDDGPDGRQIKVVDFGSGRVLDPARLEALRITNLAITGQVEKDSRSGSPLYLAPEVLAGHVPTVSADIYALGIMLYQIVAGDFRKPLAAGWEADIADPLLREDIALSAAGDPERRLSSAAILAERLGTLPRRRIERDKLVQAEERARIAERAVERTRARRPWIVAVIAALVVGASASFALYRDAARERDAAQRQRSIAESVDQFLSVDFLGRSSPYRSGKADETLVGAVKTAAPDIDRRFKNEPMIAARLYQAIARALDKRNDWADARVQYDRAAKLYEKAEGASGPHAVTVRLQRAMMEARSYQGGSLKRAAGIVAAQEKRVAAMRHKPADVAVWLASAKGMVALIGNHLHEAVKQFRTAADRGKSLKSLDAIDRLNLTQRLAFTLFRLDDNVRAEKLFRALADGFAQLEGRNGPDVLQTRLNIVQTMMQQGKNADVVRETAALYPVMVQTFGPDHEMTLQLLATRAQSEGALEDYAGAVHDDLMLHRRAVKKLGPGSFFAIASLTDAATAQCRSGQVATGLKNAQQAHQDSGKAFGAQAALTQGVAFTWAECLIDASRFDEAKKLIDGIDVAAVAQLAADAYWGANVNLARAEIALSRKDYAVARRQLAAAGPAFARSAAEPYQKRLYERLKARADRGPGGKLSGL